jgi:hypothetical protein
MPRPTRAMHISERAEDVPREELHHLHRELVADVRAEVRDGREARRRVQRIPHGAGEVHLRRVSASRRVLRAHAVVVARQPRCAAACPGACGFVSSCGVDDGVVQRCGRYGRGDAVRVQVLCFGVTTWGEDGGRAYGVDDGLEALEDCFSRAMHLGEPREEGDGQRSSRKKVAGDEAKRDWAF